MNGSGSHSPNAASKQANRLEMCATTLVPTGTSNGFNRSGATDSSPTVSTSRSSNPSSVASHR
ncbi:MAG: hypothetical protein AUI10_05980 [Actinobacteria bacterium 13_2_20CM_2_72_6]|nr:MAG: hypothetical protein AUI10_05980 [Actinobacteria bacterium 13_2_20CM_2_72_6]